eukprot:TRINITY_DN6613_c1_g5_i1.p1 TRINITY_DN6613_c1_g5~~TRINITY_DN6613_c1_g5_i1.p1  ORF type:complete len:586 (+),score=162.90 TRINITY_DN6613_c1_g5_i1:83-1840(+)
MHSHWSPDGESLALRIGNSLRLPFELGVCLCIEFVARLAHAIDDAVEPLPARRCPKPLELMALMSEDPLNAFLVALRPFLPVFRRSLCEGARAGREAQWQAYETQAKAAADMTLEVDWRSVARASLIWLWRQLRLGWRSGAPRLKAGAQDLLWYLRARRVWGRLRRLVGRPPLDAEGIEREEAEALLASARSECALGKEAFQAGRVLQALERYGEALQALQRAEAKRGAVAPSTVAALRQERVRALVNTAVCNKKLGKLSEVVDATTQALELEPKHAKALLLRAGALLGGGCQAEDAAARAASDLEAALELEPGNVAAKGDLRRARAAQMMGATPAQSSSSSPSPTGAPERPAAVAAAGAGAEASRRPLTRERLLEALATAARSQAEAQKEVSELARRVAGERQDDRLSFEEAYRRVEAAGLTRDPLANFGIGDLELQQQLHLYAEDEEVMTAAAGMLHPQGSGDPDRVRDISTERVVEIHECMVREMKGILEEYERMPEEQRCGFTPKGREVAAELLASIAIEREYRVRSEDVEQAVILKEQELQGNARFARCSEELGVMMQALVGGADIADMGGVGSDLCGMD